MSIIDQYRDAHEATAEVLHSIKGLTAAGIDVMLHRDLLEPHAPGGSSVFALLEAIEEKVERAQELLEEQWEAAHHVVRSER